MIHFITSLSKACLAHGITTFDLADIYGEYGYEALFGAALALEPELRSQMELITKCGILYPCKPCEGTYVKHYDLTKEYILKQANRSLASVGTTYIDVLLVHRPSPFMDPKVIAEAFNELHAAGKVRAFGVSNFTTSQFTMLQKFCSMPLVTNQVEASVTCLNAMYDGSFDQCITNR